MQFIKDNLFYTSLVAIVVVVGGSLVAMNFSTHEATYGQTGSKEAPFLDMSKQISKLRSKPRVNDRVNKAREKGVQETVRLLRRVEANSNVWSRGDGRDKYTPMVLPKYKGGTKIGTGPAFPIVKKTFLDFDQRFYASDEYGKRMLANIKRLHPASYPTDKEIEEEIKRNMAIDELRIRARLHEEEMQRLKDEARGKDGKDGKDAKDGKDGGVGTPRPPLRGRPPRTDTDRRMGGPQTGTDGKEITPEVTQEELATIALNNMRMFKAGLPLEGKDEQPPEVSVYADPAEALELIFPAPKTDASDEDLWDAQLHLWIVGDIVDAIAGINDMSLRRPKDFRPAIGGKPTTAPARTLPLRRTVPDSAIKHLVSITVPRGYVTGRGVAAGPAGGLRRPVPGAVDPRMHGEDGRRTPAQTTIGTGSNITGRVTCKQYEIKHYSFTVVMDLRYLPDLQRAILTSNHHTILNVTMTAPDISDSDTNRRYYGTGAVMKITIEGELLMLSGWTRGKWLPDENKWAEGYERLMPAKVLRAIYNQDPGALRDEDVKRMNEEI